MECVFNLWPIAIKHKRVVDKKTSEQREREKKAERKGLLVPRPRNVAVALRDGTVVYTDIFRPVSNETIPAIVAWSPYGKDFGSQWLNDMSPARGGVPLSKVSELQKFEGADPAYWVAQGYAILNPDVRGAFGSDGNITSWGRQLAEDGVRLRRVGSSSALVQRQGGALLATRGSPSHNGSSQPSSRHIQLLSLLGKVFSTSSALSRTGAASPRPLSRKQLSSHSQETTSSRT